MNAQVISICVSSCGQIDPAVHYICRSQEGSVSDAQAFPLVRFNSSLITEDAPYALRLKMGGLEFKELHINLTICYLSQPF